MSQVMYQLHEEHRNIARLLAVLERELAMFERAERPDYDVLSAIADYFVGFPDLYHHPKENLILERLRAREPAVAEMVGNLEGEHEKIGKLAENFQEAVENVLKEVEVPRSAFANVLRHFIDDQRKHMMMEEQKFFPLAVEHLTSEDWAEIERQTAGHEDPLFGASVAREFKHLLDNILQWEADDEEKRK